MGCAIQTATCRLKRWRLIAAGITAVPAILLLVLLGLYGLLLVFGVSVADIPQLIRGGWRELGGSPSDC